MKRRHLPYAVAYAFQGTRNNTRNRSALLEITAVFALMGVFLTLVVILVKQPIQREVDRLRYEVTELKDKIEQQENTIHQQTLELRLLKQREKFASERLRELQSARQKDSDNGRSDKHTLPLPFPNEKVDTESRLED